MSIKFTRACSRIIVVNIRGYFVWECYEYQITCLRSYINRQFKHKIIPATIYNSVNYINYQKMFRKIYQSCFFLKSIYI